MEDVEEFLNFYHHQLSQRVLILSHMKFYSILLFGSIIGVCILIYISSIVIQIITLFLLLISVILLINFKKKKQKIIESKLFKGSLFEEKKKRLKIFFKKYDIKKLPELKDKLHKEAEKRKVSGLLFPGLAAAMFVALWTSFTGSIFDKIDNEITAICYFFLFCYFIFVLLILISFFRDYLDGDSNILREIIELIDNIDFNQKDK